MAGTGKKWLIGCGLGCGIPLLLSIVLTVGGGLFMMKPFNRAIDSQEELATAHGMRGEFAPDAAGLTPERLEHFLAVRRVLMPLCADFAEMGRRVQRIDNLEQDGGEPSKAEAFKAVGDVMGAAFGLAGNIGRYTEARNDALLQEGMGLGEYAWTYVLVYNSWLGFPPNTSFEPEDEGRFPDSTQQMIRRFMSDYSQALAVAGRAEEASAWAAEAARLERSDGAGVPWEGAELPGTLAADLEPYRAQLEEVFCGPSATFEFSELKKKGLSITSD